MGNRVFCQHGKTIGSDQVRDTVVNLRVYMVRSSGQYNAPLSVFFHPGKSFFPFFLHIRTGCQQFFPASVGCHTDLSFRDLEFFSKFPYQTVC